MPEWILSVHGYTVPFARPGLVSSMHYITSTQNAGNGEMNEAFSRGLEGWKQESGAAAISR